MAVNLRGYLAGCKYAIPHMLARGKGAIVMTASGSGNMGDLSNVAYGTSKAAIIGMNRYVATIYGKQGIRCNVVNPGLTRTEGGKRNVHGPMVEIMEHNTLTPRLGQPEDIAAAVVFLLSDDAAFITGAELDVDGGMLCHSPYMTDILQAYGGGQAFGGEATDTATLTREEQTDASPRAPQATLPVRCPAGHRSAHRDGGLRRRRRLRRRRLRAGGDRSGDVPDGRGDRESTDHGGIRVERHDLADRDVAGGDRRADQDRIARRHHRSVRSRSARHRQGRRGVGAWANENGGINGQPVELVFKDSANDPAKASAAAKELVEQDGVIAITLADGSAEDAVGPYLNEQRIPVVGGSDSAPTCGASSTTSSPSRPT